MADGDFLLGIVEGMLDAVRPVRGLVASTDSFESLLLQFGWQAPEDTTYLAALQSALAIEADIEAVVAEISEIVARNDFDLDDVVALSEAAVDILERLRGFAASPPAAALPPPLDTSDFWASFAIDLADYLIARYLEVFQPALYAPLHLFGIIDDTEVPANGVPGRIDYVRTRIEWSRLGRMLTDPDGVVRETYGWGQTFLYEKLLARLQRSLSALGVPSSRYTPHHALVSDYYDATNPALNRQSQLKLGLYADDLEELGRFELGVELLAIPPRNQPSAAPSGFLLGPYFVGQAAASIPLGAALSLELHGGLEADAPVGIEVRPGEIGFRATPSGSALDLGLTLVGAPSEPWVLVGSPRSHRLELGHFAAAASLLGNPADPDLRLSFELGKLALVLELGDGDGLLNKLFGTEPQRFEVDANVVWSSKTGLAFAGRAGLELQIPLHLKLGDVAEIEQLVLKIKASPEQVSALVTADAKASIGPIAASVQGIGAQATFKPLPAGERGTFGNLDVGFGFKAPDGLGISLDVGPIAGGGFLAIEPEIGRYSGAVQLSIYSVAVSAFGIIDTRFPDGKKGFSFVIVISAEFPSIQLGFGFTLLGVGGLIGINRTLVSEELSKLVLAGTSGELLFPKNLIQNAASIIRDLGAVFPAREGHYVFGPLAKLGWGTPTLIAGEIGVILELPGPVITLLGEVRLRLPKPDAPLLSFNLSVRGELDFPHKSFALDAALHDSIIGGFPVSGQMALRLGWGNDPNFVLSIGGFHPAYKPPPNFPRLQPLALDLGKQGSASVTVSGFFAVTSNTLQIGGDVKLHAGGSGISLDASLGVKALFVFTPFSFEANIDASVKVSFHGHGPGAQLHGVLSGPTPWRARGEVCVSILWWDACLRFDHTFSDGKAEELPEIDPWLGAAGPPEVIGLQAALADAKNWASEPPVGTLRVVSLARGSETLVDPLGGLSVRERVVPLETASPITRFGAAKTPAPMVFSQVKAALLGPNGDVPLAVISAVQDFFAPAQYFTLNDGKKLSAKSFEKYQAGYRLGANTNDLELGSQARKPVSYETIAIGADGSKTELARYEPSTAHVDAASTKSATARHGTQRLGTQRFIDPRRTQAFQLASHSYLFADTTTLRGVPAAPPPASRTEALIALDAHIASQPEQRGRVQVVAVHELV
jgi:hypothetical protein